VCFEKRLTLINSQLPSNPRASAGVALIINKSLIDVEDLETTELIKGRALAIRFKWHGNNEITILNVYTPNDRNDHTDFWEQIDTIRRTKRLKRPDIMLGDFNLTKEAIDRAPAHLDDVRAIAALRNLRQCLGVKDEWRHVYPNKRSFTYQVKSNRQQIMSRLDRIYVSNQAVEATFEWRIKQTPVPTDHWMVSTKYVPAQAPYIGKGRWTMQVPEIKNKTLTDKIVS
jgi:exonuclease III